MIRIALGTIILACAAVAQPAPSGRWTVWYGDGATIEIRTESTGKNVPLSTSGSQAVAPGSDFQRLVYANDSKAGTVLFGYDIDARRSGLGSYAIRIKPIDASRVFVRGGGRAVAIPTLVATREFGGLRRGDAVEVDILSHPATGERIYDVLTVGAERSGKQVVSAQPGAQRFFLYAPTVAVDGRTVRESREFTMQGNALGIDLPGRGRFYFALAAPKGVPSQPAAWVDRNVLRFHAGSELVEVVARRSVLEHAEFATLWVYHEPDRRPRAAAGQTVAFACGDDIESLTRLVGSW